MGPDLKWWQWSAIGVICFKPGEFEGASKWDCRSQGMVDDGIRQPDRSSTGNGVVGSMIYPLDTMIFLYQPVEFPGFQGVVETHKVLAPHMWRKARHSCLSRIQGTQWLRFPGVAVTSVIQLFCGSSHTEQCVWYPADSSHLRIFSWYGFVQMPFQKRMHGDKLTMEFRRILEFTLFEQTQDIGCVATPPCLVVKFPRSFQEWWM